LDRVSSEKVSLDRVSSEKVSLDRVSSEKVSLDRVSSEKVSFDKVSSETGDTRSFCIKGGEFLVHLTDLAASLPDGVN